MEKRALRSSARLAAAQAAATSNTNPDNDKNTDTLQSTASSSASATAARHRALYKPNPLTSETAQEGITRRVKKDAQLRKLRREELVSAKRYKRSKETEELTGDEETVELEKEQIDSVQALLKSGKKSDKTDALKTLSDYLTSYNDSKDLQAMVTNGDFMKIIEGILTGTDAEEQLLAASVVTNMAAGGSAELCDAALSTAPHLIQFLDSQNIALVDQSAWALGNIAAEGPKLRDRLKDLGALPPLIKLLESKDLNLVQTVCFALSNMARGEGANQEELVKAGLLPSLLHHLRVDTDPAVISEAAWVIVYLTTGPDNISAQLLENRLIPLLVAPLKDFLDRKALAIPLIRALGNIASGPDNNTSALIHEPEFLPSMLQLIQSDCRPVKKESLWLMSNITADHASQDLIKVIEAGFIPVLSQIVTHQNFDIRKEAAYSLINLASHGPEYAKVLPHQELLPGFLDFMRTKDIELISLGLRYVQLLLNSGIAEAPTMLSEMNGVDALESVLVLSEDRDQHRLASLLMDTYFGENNNGSRVPTPIPGTPTPDHHNPGSDSNPQSTLDGDGSTALPPQYLKRASLSAAV
ncbi:armadillo-type protein [Lobosporangium transversale]|uniref:Importin subunit alpha n=1 Tax=Lobosporangium transversale TaxID=64571 RepID=A0A1Y2GEH4_9FUNG|nr:armadillo-type protein [Lobosporangium transversale]ORZ08580.1 armadillo-type protein [Lobosporangium transversale]|eukprot:XP_021878508.1 armadillo-type protein [Lobosporangium transversale]